MKIRVKPDTVQLPHKLSARGKDFSLAPSAEVPDDYGHALIKTNPGVYEIAEGPDPDLSLYKFKTEFKKQSIQDVLSTLDDAGTLAVFEFATAVKEGKQPPTEGSPGPQLSPLSSDAVALANTFMLLSESAQQRVLGYVSKALKAEG